MFEYVVILIILIWLSVKYDYSHKAGSTTFGKRAVFLLLILMSGLRNHVGVDTYNYEVFFNEYPSIGELGRYLEWEDKLTQPLWFIFNILCKSIWDNFVFFQIVEAVIFNLLLYRFINKSTRYFFTSLLLIYCVIWWNLSFEVMREALCVGFYLNGLLYLKENKIKGFLIYSIPALFLHNFAFVIFLVTLIFYYLNRKTATIVIAVLCLASIFFDSSVVSNFFILASVSIAENKSEIVESYFMGDKYGVASLNIFGVIMQSFTIVMPICILLDKHVKKDRIDFLSLLLLTGFFIFQSKYPIMSRYLNYLWPISLIIAVKYLYSCKMKSALYSAVMASLIFIVVSYSVNFYKAPKYEKTSVGYNVRYIPYKSVLEDTDPLRENVYYK